MKKPFSKLKEAIGPVPRSQLILSFGIALLLAFLALNTDLFRVEAFFYDFRMRLKGNEAPSSEILLLPLGDKPLEGTASIDSIATHRVVLEKLIAQKPKAIVYLNRFDPAEIDARPAEAEGFVALAREAERQGIRIYLGSDVDLSGEVLPAYPLSLLPHYPSILHKDGTMFAEDKVMRRTLLTAFGKPTIHLRAAYPNLSDAELMAHVPQVRGAYYYKEADAYHVLIRFPRNTAVATHGFAQLSFSDAYEGKDLSRAAGKIILVETMRKEPMNDYAYTPYSRDTYTNPRLAVHAASLDSLLKDAGIVLMSRNFDAGLTFVLALTLAFVGITMRPSRGIVALFILSISLFLASLFIFWLGFSVRLVHPLLAMFFTYYLIVPYRAIFEYKKRWEVQEKHDILVQVEEMKGNFLSLMSHDLKTPVAQIQGLAELVLRQGNLKVEQQEEMRQILE
ncbi:MAG: CHASE2 domain-containing protein, partial [Proteobacteria bacterium]